MNIDNNTMTLLMAIPVAMVLWGLLYDLVKVIYEKGFFNGISFCLKCLVVFVIGILFIVLLFVALYSLFLLMS